MSALAKPAIQPAAQQESSPKLSVVMPEAEPSSRDGLALGFMLIACAAFVGVFVASLLIPAIKTILGT